MSANIVFVTKVEGGWLLEDDEGMDYGVADTLQRAIDGAKAIVEIGYAKNYCIND